MITEFVWEELSQVSVLQTILYLLEDNIYESAGILLDILWALE